GCREDERNPRAAWPSHRRHVSPPPAHHAGTSAVVTQQFACQLHEVPPWWTRLAVPQPDEPSTNRESRNGCRANLNPRTTRAFTHLRAQRYISSGAAARSEGRRV